MNRKKSGKLQLALIAAVFLGPVLIGAWLYFSGSSMVPEGRSNHGALLEPIVSLGDELPDSPIHPLHEKSWVLVYANPGECDETCRDALYTLRQSRLMLGKEMDRLTRVFLHGETAPDTVFLATEHAGLMTIEDASLAGLLDNKRPDELREGGYFLIDPLGNLVMYFRPDIDPSDMVDDIKHLLRLSRIG